ncbi:MAG: T9SS type A sorting domain-containing protein [Candidatus Cloacimonetes bacterium]|nr:T9SS type A sorting domain-containing protein [Candidatus Cloacimonadota bacterium]
MNVHIVDLYIEGADPNDGIPMVPWDLNEDGEVDEYTENGYVGFVTSVPSWSWFGEAQDAFFYESNFKLSINDNWVIAVWQDAENVYFNYYDEPGYEDWAEKSQIAIAVSRNYGTTWSQPAFLNANINDENYYEELDGMIPAYVYPADQLEVIDPDHAKLHLFFMDDYSYGSFQQSNGANEGGMLMYAALNIGHPNSSANTVVSIPNAVLHQNYPNPFNPETTIGFDMKEAGNVSIEVFNMKGQKVRTLVNNRNYPTGYNSEIWNGKDNNINSVSSGVYFYKLNTDSYSTVRRMLLIQ